MKTFKEMKAELTQDPEFRAEYERLRPEFELARVISEYLGMDEATKTPLVRGIAPVAAG